MTRKERELVVQELLSRYEDVGRIIVSDEHCLGRLLAVVHRVATKGEVTAYLAAFISV